MICGLAFAPIHNFVSLISSLIVFLSYNYNIFNVCIPIMRSTSRSINLKYHQLLPMLSFIFNSRCKNLQINHLFAALHFLYQLTTKIAYELREIKCFFINHCQHKKQLWIDCLNCFTCHQLNLKKTVQIVMGVKNAVSKNKLPIKDFSVCKFLVVVSMYKVKLNKASNCHYYKVRVASSHTLIKSQTVCSQ